ncbi:MAG: tRNA (N(6)-L-threonylcarbamoyladenosine(37)-C(2))-methylthiotransferase MtaB [Anaerolineae bacterium]
MNVYLSALGCKLNWAELEGFRRELVGRGHAIVDAPAQADWAIVNTCAVTHVAARKSRQAIRKLRRENPSLRVAAVGCYAEIAPGTVRSLDGVKICLGNRAKDDVVGRILASEPPPREEHRRPIDPTDSPRTRAFCKIQDGCDNHCTYCIVTIARGVQRSVSPQAILAEIRELVDEGYQEVVLTGVHIGAYGHDADPSASPNAAGWDLPKLVRWLLAEIRIPRLRLSSIEPWDVTDALLDLWPHPHLCPHLHLPLQSGCDATLHRMARRYSTDDFRQRVHAFRQRVPHGAITTDVIVGFHGETDQEFEETVAFVQEMAFSRLHVFRYSPRPGTAALRLPDQVSPRVAKKRSQKMRDVGQALSRNYHQSYLGHTVPVLFENRDDGQWTGLTDTYIRASVASPNNLHNQIVPVRCVTADARGIGGELLASS